MGGGRRKGGGKGGGDSKGGWRGPGGGRAETDDDWRGGSSQTQSSENTSQQWTNQSSEYIQDNDRGQSAREGGGRSRGKRRDDGWSGWDYSTDYTSGGGSWVESSQPVSSSDGRNSGRGRGQKGDRRRQGNGGTGNSNDDWKDDWRGGGWNATSSATSPVEDKKKEVEWEPKKEEQKVEAVEVEEQPKATSSTFAAFDIRYEQDCQDVRYAPNPPAGKKQDSGKNKSQRGGGGGNKQEAAKGGAEKSSRGGRKRGGGGNKDQNSAGSGEKVVDHSNQALNKILRTFCTLYEQLMDDKHLQEAYEALKTSIEKEEGCCDSAMVHQLLLHLTKNAKLSRAHNVVDWAKEYEIYLDVAQIVSIITSISQRTQTHNALGFVRRLIYESLPPDYGIERRNFFDRHASFIFSEFMAEADACFGRMNRDTNMLVGAGHTELNIQLDWDQSTASSYKLFNRETDKGKRVYTPTAGVALGIQRTDCALMSFDIRLMEMAKEVPSNYDCVRDGCEVEVTAAQTDANKPTELTVKVSSPPKIIFKQGMYYRLDKLASRDQTRRMMESLKIVLAQPQDNPKGQKSSLQPSEKLQELLLVDKSTTLTKAGKTELPCEQMPLDADKASGYESFQEDAKTRYMRMLNPSQTEALMRACGQRITLIQGPPGTGKTTTAVQIVSALVQYQLVDLPMLVTADSNTAVDNLVKGVAKEGLKVIRVGRPESIREDVKQYALDGRWKELHKVEVICATCIGASGSTMEKLRFGTVLIDECTQASESAALVPIARGCQQVILIGDQCQLPPTVLSDVSESQNLGESLFTRLVTQGVRPVLLDTQYRMHPYICEFPSAAFYNGRLHTGVSYSKRLPPDGFNWPQRGMPVAFVNMERAEERREGQSYMNAGEADKTLWALQEVCSTGEIGPEGVGLVTPYKGQVNYIKKLIRERPALQKFRTGLEVESVDGFQGQEKEVIIFCAVRNNAEGKVGFLSDWRRLNVMLTRARRGCIVIGSKRTLMQDPLWRQWLIWAQARGAICGEAAKGTWVGRYLVDDRDGMWTVKEQLLLEPDKIPPVVPMPAKGSAKKVEVKEETVMDDWEELFSPSGTPTASPKAGAQEDLEDWEKDDAPESPSRGMLPPPVAVRCGEEDEVRTKSTPTAKFSSVLEDLNDEKFERQRSHESSIHDGEDEIRCLGTPTHAPKSPARQQALANLGLVDDLDLDADEEAKGVSVSAIDAAFDVAAQPELPPELRIKSEPEKDEALLVPATDCGTEKEL
mmetsp:Transcript_28461/g.45723  ORF Transcript_28461/g.45723 Transcript_28461/m.45723 type:complete len:1255 (-) Transcript_28461:467-4231(-)